MVSLETLRETAPKASLHVDEDDFRITSAVPLADLARCDVLSCTLPGRIGRYILPRDAVITLKAKTRTTPSDVRSLLDLERARNARTHRNRMNHVTVQKRGEGVDESEEEDELSDELVEEEQDEGGEGGGDLSEEEGNAEDWEEEACQNDVDAVPSK
jgi:hypothetical protein